MLFYELCKHPKHQDLIYNEVKALTELTGETLKALPHLNAVIKEVLRLHPAVPSGGYRDTPPEGLRVGDTLIPGSVTMVVPRIVIARSQCAPG